MRRVPQAAEAGRPQGQQHGAQPAQLAQGVLHRRFISSVSLARSLSLSLSFSLSLSLSQCLSFSLSLSNDDSSGVQCNLKLYYRMGLRIRAYRSWFSTLKLLNPKAPHPSPKAPHPKPHTQVHWLLQNGVRSSLVARLFHIANNDLLITATAWGRKLAS